MAKLKLGVLDDDKPVKVTHELPASVHRDLVAYAEILARESSQPISDPVKLIAPMLARFMATPCVCQGSPRPRTFKDEGRIALKVPG